MVRISKYLAKHLRHQPERIGLTLASDGWVPIEVLLAACQRHNFPLTRGELDEVVAENNKRRYAYDPRAHSSELARGIVCPSICTCRRFHRQTCCITAPPGSHWSPSCAKVFTNVPGSMSTCPLIMPRPAQWEHGTGLPWSLWSLPEQCNGMATPSTARIMVCGWSIMCRRRMCRC